MTSDEFTKQMIAEMDDNTFIIQISIDPPETLNFGKIRGATATEVGIALGVASQNVKQLIDGFRENVRRKGGDTAAELFDLAVIEGMKHENGIGNARVIERTKSDPEPETDHG